MRDIYQAIEEHKHMILAAGFKEENLLGVFLYGSQNYRTETENSDVDTKAIIIPTFEELVFKRPISRELVLPNNEHCEVKDIREMVSNFRKQNINFIEILYTDYCWINPKYMEVWDKYFLSMREKISHYDRQKCVNSISHQALHTIRQNRNDGKKISNGLRLQEFLSLYTCGFEYMDCLIPMGKIRKTIMELKNGEITYSDKEIDDMIDFFENILKKDFQSSEKLRQEVDKNFNEAIIKLIKENI